MSGRLAVLVLWLAAGGPSRAGERETMALDDGWRVARTASAAAKAPARGWEPTAVPGMAWGDGVGEPEFLWYRKTLRVPVEWAGRRIFLRLGGARYDPHVFVDGGLVAARLDGYTPFEVDLTGRVVAGATHRLEVRCRDWSATFADGFRLPGPVEGELRYAPKGKVLAPIGGHFGFFGLWDDAALISLPRVSLDDVAIVPSVREGTITIRGRVSGDRIGRDLRAAASILDAGGEVLRLPPVHVGADGRWELRSPFPGARPWSPEDPHRYTARIVLVDTATRDGVKMWFPRDDVRAYFPFAQEMKVKTADVLDEPFGFRELWVEGPDFFLNGAKRHLLATSGWPSPEPLTRERIRTVLEQVKASNAVAFRLHTQPWRKAWVEVADEVGVMIVMEAALWCDSGGSYAYQDPRFWKHYRGHLERMVKRDRNHASLVMWSLENELLHCGAGRFDEPGRVEAKLADLGRFVKALDPAHLITFESDHDPGGTADVIGLHYPHELPDHHDYPNTCDWLGGETVTGTAGGLLGSRRASFTWDRNKPLYIGEYLWVPTADGTPGTVFFGDEAYADADGFHRRAKAAAWRDQTVAYRRAGVSGLTPWTQFESGSSRFPLDLNPEANILFQAQREAYRHRAVFLRERDTRFYGGKKVRRTCDVFNDTPERRAFTLRWTLEGAREGGRKRMVLPAAGHRAITVKLRLPRVAARTGMSFSAELLEGGEVVHRAGSAFEVHPRAELRPPGGARLVLYDPSGRWRSRLGKVGLETGAVRSLEGLKDVEPAAAVLLVAPGAFEPPGPGGARPRVGNVRPEGPALAAFLRRGGRALVMEQEALSGLPLNVRLVDHGSTMTFALAPDHPVLDGIAEADLKFWGPGHYVSRREIRRPAAGGARALVVSGGRRGIDQGPVLEVPYGAGLALLLQARVGDLLGTEPVAARMLGNAVSYLASWKGGAGDTVVVSGAPDFLEHLARLRVDAVDRTMQLRTAHLDRARLLVLHGGGPRIADAIDELAGFLAGGGTAYWHVPNPELFDRLCRTAGIEDVRLEPASGPIVLTAPGRGVLAGVAREDVDFRGAGHGPSWMGATSPDPAVIGQALTVARGEDDMVRHEAGDMAFSAAIGDLVDGGKRLNLSRNGRATLVVSVAEPGFYPVSVVAAGTPLGGVWPQADVRVGGRTAARLTVSSRTPRAHRFVAELEAGETELAVSFTNDAYSGGEDRNLALESVSIGKRPLGTSAATMLSMPAGIALIPAGKGRLVVDHVRWDLNEGNRVRGDRYASALLANLGAAFAPPDPAAEWVPGGAFEARKAASGPYFSVADGEIRGYSAGEAAASFDCVKAGRYALWVLGRSTPAAGGFAVAEVSIDGEPAGEAELSARSERAFAAGEVTLTEGTHEVVVRFANDLNADGEDRNLWVTGVGFSILP